MCGLGVATLYLWGRFGVFRRGRRLQFPLLLLGMFPAMIAILVAVVGWSSP